MVRVRSGQITMPASQPLSVRKLPQLNTRRFVQNHVKDWEQGTPGLAGQLQRQLVLGQHGGQLEIPGLVG